MERPMFTLRDDYEKIIKQVKNKKIKWIVGDLVHIKVVDYAKRKGEYIEQMEEYCLQNGLTFSEEAYHGPLLEYKVTIHYSGFKTFTVKATSEEGAEEEATQQFDAGGNWDSEITDVDVA